MEGAAKKGHSVLRGPKAVKFAFLEDYRGILSKARACRVMGVTDRVLRTWHDVIARQWFVFKP